MEKSRDPYQLDARQKQKLAGVIRGVGAGGGGGGRSEGGEERGKAPPYAGHVNGRPRLIRLLVGSPRIIVFYHCCYCLVISSPEWWDMQGGLDRVTPYPVEMVYI